MKTVQLVLTLSLILASCPCMEVYGQGGLPIKTAVRIKNIAPTEGVAITPVWVGFHSGNFDSYNGGLLALPGLERIAEDGNATLISQQFLDVDAQQGGYTYINNVDGVATSELVRTQDLNDAFRQDATVGSAPLLPGQAAVAEFALLDNGANNYFSYVSMVLPTNDFFIANGNPLAHSISSILADGGEISFFIGTPNGGVNDAGTEIESFEFSAGNPLFPNRNLPAGQTGPDQGPSTSLPIANVIGFPFTDFISQGGSSDVDLTGLDFNQYEDGIAMVTITANFIPGDANNDGSVNLLDVDSFVQQVANGQYSAVADLNRDGEVNLLDVTPFVQIFFP